MRVIIAGWRHCRDVALVRKAIQASGFEVTTVISGGARGVDSIGELLACTELHVPVVRYHADWAAHGKAAGPMRNQEMALNADALVAVSHPESRGTADMIARARRLGLQVYVEHIPAAQ